MFTEFEERLRKAGYSEKSGVGFLADRLTPQHIEATYIERKLRKSEIAGPLGNVQRLEWFEFITYLFMFDRRRRIVEIDSSARSLAPLIQQFGALAGWKSSFEPLILEPAQFLDFLRNGNFKFDVTKLKADDVTLSINTATSLEVIGQTSILKDLDRLLGPRKRTITSFAIIVTERSKTFRIDVSNAGRIVTESAAYDDALALCRKAVDWAQAKK